MRFEYDGVPVELAEVVRSITKVVGPGRAHPESPLPVDYLGQIQLQQPVTPEPDAVHEICRYASAHPGRGEEMAYCGALLARVEYDRGDPRASPEVLHRLRVAARLSPADETARCELGKALAWAGEWQGARMQMEACVRLDPDSAEAHYRLAHVYLRLGQTGPAKREMKLHDLAVERMISANARRDATLKKFLYTISRTPSHQS